MSDHTPFDDPCPKCSGENTYLEKSGPHVKWSCPKCGFIKFISQEKPANLFVMPFGKYKGSSLQEIKDMDIDYCIWAAENLTTINIKMKFKDILTEL